MVNTTKSFQRTLYKLQKLKTFMEDKGVFLTCREYEIVTYQTWVLIHHPDSAGCRHH